MIIVLKITDSETLEAYKNIHPDLIFADLINGNLLQVCELVEVKEEDSKKAEAEILRLREGLRDLRYGIFKDAATVNGFIDNLLKIEDAKEF